MQSNVVGWGRVEVQTFFLEKLCFFSVFRHKLKTFAELEERVPAVCCTSVRMPRRLNLWKTMDTYCTGAQVITIFMFIFCILLLDQISRKPHAKY